MQHRVGYLFSRFPVFTQTFCARELAELYRQGFNPPVYSLLRPSEHQVVNVALNGIPIHYVPDLRSLAFRLKTMLAPAHLKKLWSGSGDRRDKGRFREAIYLAAPLRHAGVQHLHVHFASLAARTAWWLKRLFGITYSFTGHANDIFRPKPNQRVSLADLISEASFVVTVSDYSAEMLRRDYPDAAHKIFRIYNGVDPSQFSRADAGAEPLKIVSIGRLIEKKGFTFLVKACALLRAAGVNFECRICGDGPERERIQEMVKAHDLAGMVHLAGEKPQDQIVQFLAESSLFVLPAVRDSSGDMDNLPTVLIESMASALPVVATRIAGIPEIVQEGVNGVLVEPGDAEQLAGAIGTLAANPDLRERYGAASRLIVEQKFALPGTAAELKELLLRQMR